MSQATDKLRHKLIKNYRYNDLYKFIITLPAFVGHTCQMWIPLFAVFPHHSTVIELVLPVKISDHYVEYSITHCVSSIMCALMGIKV